MRFLFKVSNLSDIEKMDWKLRSKVLIVGLAKHRQGMLSSNVNDSTFKTMVISKIIFLGTYQHCAGRATNTYLVLKRRKQYAVL